LGFLRGVGYFFAVIILIFGFLSLLHGVPWIGLGIIIFAIIIIAILRRFDKNAQMRKDIHYMAEKEKEKREEEKGELDEKQEKKLKDEEELREEQRLKDEIKRLEDKKKQLEKEKGD
jgi:flagellar biosynthesis/type III secretory pathway M-ring protein FliF/YscJ